MLSARRGAQFFLAETSFNVASFILKLLIRVNTQLIGKKLVTCILGYVTNRGMGDSQYMSGFRQFLAHTHEISSRKTRQRDKDEIKSNEIIVNILRICTCDKSGLYRWRMNIRFSSTWEHKFRRFPKTTPTREKTRYCSRWNCSGLYDTSSYITWALRTNKNPVT